MTLYRLEPLPPTLTIDVVYASRDNFMGEVMYDAPIMGLVEEAANAVARAYHLLREEGYGVLLFDGYRPISVQQKMWDKIQDERFVSNPKKNGGRHTRGTAIDLTLTDLDGNELEMPTPFDSFSEKAAWGFTDLPKPILERRSLLLDVMKEVGFEPIPTEWWHFDLRDWEDYLPLDLPLSDLKKAPLFQWEGLLGKSNPPPYDF